MIQKEPLIRRLLEKVRHLVNKFRKSSVATERLLQKCAMVLVKDCPTRWSSCFAMILRRLNVKEHLTSVAESMGWDQGRRQALLDLKKHMSVFSLAHGRRYKEAATLAQKMLSRMDRRFSVSVFQLTTSHHFLQQHALWTLV
ncbi:unnamed protein product [Boreogadus saida]